MTEPIEPTNLENVQNFSLVNEPDPKDEPDPQTNGEPKGPSAMTVEASDDWPDDEDENEDIEDANQDCG